MWGEGFINDQQIIVGADIGGSKAALAYRDASGTRREHVVPSAAWHRQGEGGVARSLAELLRAEVAAERYVIAVGAHGTDTVSQCERLQAELEAELPGRVLALNDAELLLPAAGRTRGIGLVSGTGSIVIGYGPGDELISVGGWGGYLSDEGSATRLFLDAARALVQARDRDEATDPMESVLLELCGIRDLRDLPPVLGDMGSPTGWAHLTPELFERSFADGSQLVGDVVTESAEVMAQLVALLGRRGCDTSVVVAGGGTIANAGWLQDALREALARISPDTELIILTSPPVDGALLLASSFASALAQPAPEADRLHPAVRRRLAALDLIPSATGATES